MAGTDNVAEVHDWLERAKETMKGNPEEIKRDLRLLNSIAKQSVELATGIARWV